MRRVICPTRKEWERAEQELRTMHAKQCLIVVTMTRDEEIEVVFGRSRSDGDKYSLSLSCASIGPSPRRV